MNPMKIVSLSCLLVAASAAPQNYGYEGSIAGGRGAAAGAGAVFHQASGPVVAILRDDRNGPAGGQYDFVYETADGISRNEQGQASGPGGSVVQQGGWSFTFPDGSQGQFSFVADEGGYRVDSPLLPVGPAIPRHALEQIEKAERERAQGIVHDGQYRGEGLQSSGSLQVVRGGYGQ